MTNDGLPEDRPKPQFMTRRERREYERAQQQAQRASEVQQAANIEQLSSGDTAYPLLTNDTGGLDSTSQRPTYTGADDHTDYARYGTEQNIDLGGLSPLPEDTRDYPDLAQDVVEQLEDERSDEEEPDEHPLGYMLVADGSQPAPEIDEEALKMRKSRKRRRTVIMLSSFAVFLALLIGVGFGVSHFVGWTKQDYPGPGGEEVQFEVLPGDGAIVVGNRLVDQDIVASTGAFRDAVEAADATSEIQPGEYTLRYEMPARDAASILLRENEGSKNYAYVNSGYRIDDVYDAIADQTSYSVKEIEEAADPANFGLPDEASSLEGYIAVGEYHFPVDASLEEILEQMIEPTMQEFDRLGIDDPEKQFRVVTIASILQAEARTEDFPEVAGIIENRLDPSNPETSGYLQIDATVIYGMGVRQLQFSAEDRKDKSNPYNTYVHRGLPPGPIGAPSIEALDASAEPKSSDNYYWITTNIETGETKFSSTYEQHQKYQREYREYCDENPDVCGRGE